MTVILELTREDEAELTKEAERQGVTPEELTRQAVIQTLISGLKNRPIPQSLDEIKPRRLPPPGKTAMQMVYQQLPVGEADETDEEVRRALEELS